MIIKLTNKINKLSFKKILQEPYVIQKDEITGFFMLTILSLYLKKIE